jgi:hypothetical protein
MTPAKTCKAAADGGSRASTHPERGRPWISAILSLTVASLGLGTYLTSLDVAGSSLVHMPQVVAARNEAGQATCRRNAFADPERPLVRIGHSCP